MSIFKTLLGALIGVSLVACGGGGGDASTPVTPSTPSATANIASILLSAPSPQTISADGSATITITARALDSSNALVKGATINLVANGASILSDSSVVTDATSGLATVTLFADPNNQTTRVATVSASCVACTASAATLPVQINGATLALTSSGGSTLTAGGNSVTLSALVTDVKGKPVSGVAVTFASTDSAVVGLGSVTATTNSAGIATTTVSGLTVGSASVTVTALGNAKSSDFTVNAAAGGLLAISSPANNSTMVTNTAQPITVSAPGATTVNFSTTLGTVTPSVVNASPFTSSLTSTQAGSATVTVSDNLGRTASIVLKVSPPVSAANKIILSASQTTIGLATSTATPSIRLTARALYSPGTGDQGVANVPILFKQQGGPGSGEYLTPAYALTDGSGYAYADFYAGNTASTQNGIQIDAQIQGTAVSTGTSPSSNPTLVTVGGQALSVAIGAASVLRESTDKTLYIQDYSVQVTDANNNPVPNSIVTLRARPVAFSTGTFCTVSATFCSEDANFNGSLDSGEDGVRVATTPTTTSQCPAINALPAPTAGKSDSLLTPQNSMAGSVPSTVTTDSTGTASFALTYLKAASIWIVDKLSATVSVNGTESGSSIIFRLPTNTVDVVVTGNVVTECHIPNSPY